MKFLKDIIASITKSNSISRSNVSDIEKRYEGLITEELPLTSFTIGKSGINVKEVLVILNNKLDILGRDVPTRDIVTLYSINSLILKLYSHIDFLFTKKVIDDSIIDGMLNDGRLLAYDTKDNIKVLNDYVTYDVEVALLTNLDLLKTINDSDEIDRLHAALVKVKDQTSGIDHILSKGGEIKEIVFSELITSLKNGVFLKSLLSTHEYVNDKLKELTIKSYTQDDLNEIHELIDPIITKKTSIIIELTIELIKKR